MASWPVAFGPLVRQYIVREACGRGNAHLMTARYQREEGAWGPNVPFRHTLPVT